MNLTTDEVLSIVNEPASLYLFKTKVTEEDMLAIVSGMSLVPSYFTERLSSLISVAKRNDIHGLTDKVISQTLFFATDLGKLRAIVGKLDKCNVQISDNAKAMFIDKTCEAYASNPDPQSIFEIIIEVLQPKFTKDIIEKHSEVLKKAPKTIGYIVKQFIDAKDYKFILDQDILFDFVSSNSELTESIVSNLLIAKDVDTIAKREKACMEANNCFHPLRSEPLKRQMSELCLQENKADVFFELTNVVNYARTQNPGLISRALDQLILNNNFNQIVTNENALTCIVNHEPDSLKRIPKRLYKTALDTLAKKPTVALGLLNLMPLPNLEWEFAYIANNNKADAKLPARDRLSPETLAYLDVVSGTNPNAIKGLTSTDRVKSALINCQFDKHDNWYKIMEQLLTNEPNMDTKFIQQMLNRDKNTDVLIKRLWKGNSKMLLLRKMISNAFQKMQGKQPKTR